MISVSLLLTHSDTPADSSLGNYYFLDFDIPDEIAEKELSSAILELYADVSARATEFQIYDPLTTESATQSITDDAPMFEVYALTSPFADSLDQAQFRSPTITREAIRAGTNRRIRIDVTEIAQFYLDNPSLNYGLLLGSVTGVRDGIFVVKSGIIGGDVVGKITFYFDRSYENQ